MAVKTFFFLTACLFASAQAQQFQGINATINDLKITKVLVGKPGLESEFKGRVVVLGCLGHDSILPYRPSPRLNDMQKARIAEDERKSKAGKEKRMREAKMFAKDFAALERKFGDNPDFRLAIVMSGLLDDPNTVANAQEVASAIELTQAIVHRDGEVEGGLSHGYVYVFDRRGVLRHVGKPDNKLDDAIRKALRPTL